MVQPRLLSCMQLLVAALLTAAPARPLPAAEYQFEIQETDEGATVLLDGELMTRYLKRSGAKPILWPIIGPTGHPVTRQFPMANAGPHEKADHPHHRSLWFNHGDVNGLSYWHEPEDGKFGTIRHMAFTQISGGNPAVIATQNQWVDDQGNVPCTDLRTMTFTAEPDARIIDFQIVVTAGPQPVRFGDTKEGSFGIRMAGPLTVDQGLGARIVNREGLTDGDAWGKRSAWVDYHGPIVESGPIVGIAILNHPTSFRFPTYWHVRTYGLFAANPFGRHNFENSNEVDGSHELQPGQTMLLRYRVIIHRGDAQAGNLESRFLAYEKSP